jgi:hypothetical protein
MNEFHQFADVCSVCLKKIKRCQVVGKDKEMLESKKTWGQFGFDIDEKQMNSVEERYEWDMKEGLKKGVWSKEEFEIVRDGLNKGRGRGCGQEQVVEICGCLTGLGRLGLIWGVWRN